MIIEVQGDILLSEAKAVAHVVAPNDDFHSGLALSLRNEWPSLYKDFRHYCRVSSPESGGVWAWKAANGRLIFNLMAQEAPRGHGDHPGKATLQLLNRSLGELRKACDEEKVETLALSRLATGVGGLSWADVKPLIESHFGTAKTRAYVYSTYRKGVKATED